MAEYERLRGRAGAIVRDTAGREEVQRAGGEKERKVFVGDGVWVILPVDWVRPPLDWVREDAGVGFERGNDHPVKGKDKQDGDKNQQDMTQHDS